MKTILKSAAFLALIVFAFSTTAFSKGEATQFQIHNSTTQNIGAITVYGSAGPVGQVVVPGPGTFSGSISATMTAVLVNNVMVAKGAIMKVALANGHVVTVNNSIPTVDINENN